MRKPPKDPNRFRQRLLPKVQVKLPGDITLQGLLFRITGYNSDGTPKTFELLPVDYQDYQGLGVEGACMLFANEEWIRSPVPGKSVQAMRCFDCDGTGKVLDSPKGAWILCPSCGGKGIPPIIPYPPVDHSEPSFHSDPIPEAVTIGIVGQDIGVCPGCGLKISASETGFSVMHELPTCPDFQSLDALAFITWVRHCREPQGGEN
jgi:hypothetical protein